MIHPKKWQAPTVKEVNIRRHGRQMMDGKRKAAGGALELVVASVVLLVWNSRSGK